MKALGRERFQYHHPIEMRLFDFRIDNDFATRTDRTHEPPTGRHPTRCRAPSASRG